MAFEIGQFENKAKQYTGDSFGKNYLEPELRIKRDADYLAIYYLDDQKVKHNLFREPGIEIIADTIEIKLEYNQVRRLNFEYSVETAFAKTADRILGKHRYEIQVKVNVGQNNTETIIFDGYVDKQIPTNETNAGYAKYRVECLGTEQILWNDRLDGKTSFKDMTSKEILEQVGRRLQAKHNYNFELVDIHTKIDHKWRDNMEHDGQIFRLIDIIKNQEQAMFYFTQGGKLHMIAEEDLPEGEALNYDKFGNSITIPHREVINTSYVNRSWFKYKDAKGALHREQYKFPVGKDNDKAFNGSVDLLNDIFEVKDIVLVNRHGVHKMADFVFDPDFKIAKGDSQWRYNFSGNTFKVNARAVNEVSQITISYYSKNSGLITLDNEKAIIEEYDRRELTSQIFSNEISNERMSNMKDIHALLQATIDWRKKEQYKVNFNIKDMGVNHEIITNWLTPKRYKFQFKTAEQVIDANGDIVAQSVDDFLIPKDELFVPHQKTIKVMIHGDGDGRVQNFTGDSLKPKLPWAVSNGTIPIEYLQMEVELETDQSLRWQNQFVRDKNQYVKHETATININVNNDWDIVRGNCDFKGAQEYTTQQLGQTTPLANPTDEFPKGYVPTKDFVEKVSIATDGNKSMNDVNCPDGIHFPTKTWVRWEVWPVLQKAWNIHPDTNLHNILVLDKFKSDTDTKAFLDSAAQNHANNPGHYFLVRFENKGYWEMWWDGGNRNYPAWSRVAQIPRQYKSQWMHTDLRVMTKDPNTGVDSPTKDWSQQSYYGLYFPYGKIDIYHHAAWFDTNTVVAMKGDGWGYPDSSEVKGTPKYSEIPNLMKIHASPFAHSRGPEDKKAYYINIASDPYKSIEGKKCPDYKFKKSYLHYDNKKTPTDKMMKEYDKTLLTTSSVLNGNNGFGIK